MLETQFRTGDALPERFRAKLFKKSDNTTQRAVRLNGAFSVLMSHAELFFINARWLLFPLLKCDAHGIHFFGWSFGFAGGSAVVKSRARSRRSVSSVNS